MKAKGHGWRGLSAVVVLTAWLAMGAGCGTKQAGTVEQTAAPVAPVAVAEEAKPEQSAPLDPSLLERIKRERWKGDLDGMIERRYIRALVTYNRSYYFYDGAEQRGLSYESLKEFEKSLNQKLGMGNRQVSVIFIPVQRGDLLQALEEGRGDIAASNIAITPEGLALVDYSDPVRDDVSNLVVTGPNSPAVTTLDDLGGREVFIRKRSRYGFMLTRLNEELKKSGKPLVILKAADENLEDEDILEMVNAGIVNITVVDSLVGELWAKVFEHLTLHPALTIAPNVDIGWAFRKNSPQLAAAVNEFVKEHKVGTAFGNTLLRRYVQNTKWIVNSTSEEEMKKFGETVEFFKRYSNEYGFDYLMVAAQAYQESRLDQSAKSAAGAVGIMQIKPSTAAGDPVNIDDVEKLDANIHAGVKYMNFMMNHYFKDHSLDRINRGLFAFASYNAGPNRIARLRKQAGVERLDPNKWFNNVEMVADREIGRETVTYVSNIYKYYVAFKLTLERKQEKKQHAGH
ncbi:MAG: transglycosylase SLT domain-containing protein [Pyrinomonadaceae bacterium]